MSCRWLYSCEHRGSAQNTIVGSGQSIVLLLMIGAFLKVEFEECKVGGPRETSTWIAAMLNMCTNKLATITPLNESNQDYDDCKALERSDTI